MGYAASVSSIILMKIMRDWGDNQSEIAGQTTNNVPQLGLFHGGRSFSGRKPTYLKRIGRQIKGISRLSLRKGVA